MKLNFPVSLMTAYNFSHLSVNGSIHSLELKMGRCGSHFPKLTIWKSVIQNCILGQSVPPLKLRNGMSSLSPAS